MKKQALLLLFLLLFFDAVAQDWKFDGNGGSVRGSFDGSNSPNQSFNEEFHLDPLKRTPSSKEKRGKDEPTPPLEGNFDGPSSESSWGGNGTYSNGLNKRMTNRLGWEKDVAEGKALSCLKEMSQLLSDNCIDINKLQNAIDKYCQLSDYQRAFLGAEGHNARAYLIARLHNMKSEYVKYSNMATDIRNYNFKDIDQKMMNLPYEDVDKYLRQFLNEKDFEEAKIEYTKYERAKALEKEIDELYDHLNDKKYLRENYDKVENKMIGLRLVDGLKYMYYNEKEYLFKLAEIKKLLQYDEIKKIPLTVSNIDTRLRSKKATKNNADWKLISEGMTSQRLLSILGLLNTDNGNVLPSFVGEVDGNYCFIGKPIKTDSKTVEKVYFVSKDGSSISLYETEGVVTNNFFDAKANYGEKKVSITDSSEGDVDLNYNAIGGKVTILKTDWHKQIKNNEYRVGEDGTILQYGAEGSVGVKSGVSGSANVNLTSNETKNVKADASIGAEVEVAHVGATLAGKWSPVMHINNDNSISFRQYSSSLEGGLSAGASSKFSISKKGVNAKVGLGVSTGVSVAFQDIDGALKQIDSDVVLGIIKSSIDDGNYKSEFKDENIGRTVISSIRREANDALRKQKR